jgi:hypothetical protein
VGRRRTSSIAGLFTRLRTLVWSYCSRISFCVCIFCFHTHLCSLSLLPKVDEKTCEKRYSILLFMDTNIVVFRIPFETYLFLLNVVCFFFLNENQTSLFVCFFCCTDMIEDEAHVRLSPMRTRHMIATGFGK